MANLEYSSDYGARLKYNTHPTDSPSLWLMEKQEMIAYMEQHRETTAVPTVTNGERFS